MKIGCLAVDVAYWQMFFDVSGMAICRLVVGSLVYGSANI